MTINPKILIPIVFGALVLGAIFMFLAKQENPKMIQGATSNGNYVDTPSIGASPDYGKDFKSYTSPLGFSFKYPPYMRIIEDPNIPTVYVATNVGEDEPFVAIVISAAENNLSLTPEQWLLSKNSGYNRSTKRDGNYYKTHVDGQEAVYTDGDMWTVVNTPDNKTRVSITFTAEGSSDIPFTEMGIVMESFTFTQ